MGSGVSASPGKVTGADVRATLAGVIAVSSVSGIRFSFGVVLPSLSTELGSPISLVATAFTLHWLIFTASAPLAWRVFARLGSRFMFVIGAVLSGLGFASLAATGSALQSIIVFGVLVGLGTHGIGQLAGNHPVLMLASFQRRDRLFGIVACGAPIGTAVFPAMTALVLDAADVRTTSLIMGTVFVVAGIAAALLIPRAYPRRGQSIPVPEQETAAPALLRQAAFLLLGAAFFLSLLMQTAVPFLLPVWGAALGFDTHQIALAFVAMGVAGLLGRFILTGQRMRLNLRLWIVVPAAVIAVTGFALAIAVSNEVLLYASTSLLGFSTSFYGALFAIASLACYPPHLFAKVSGSLLMPIGVGAAVAALLPGLVVDSGVQFSTIWSALALTVVLTALLFVGAEIVSPVRRARIARERDQTGG